MPDWRDLFACCCFPCYLLCGVTKGPDEQRTPPARPQTTPGLPSPAEVAASVIRETSIMPANPQPHGGGGCTISP